MQSPAARRGFFCLSSGVGVGAHCICAREGTGEIATATGGYKIRPYRHAPRLLVGAGFIPARARLRPAVGLRGSYRHARRGFFCLSSGVGVGAHCICAREGTGEIATATGGYKIRPYRHAPRLLVGAGFIPARARSRPVVGLRKSYRHARRVCRKFPAGFLFTTWENRGKIGMLCEPMKDRREPHGQGAF